MIRLFHSFEDMCVLACFVGVLWALCRLVWHAAKADAESKR